MLVCPNCRKVKFESEWTYCMSPICDECRLKLEKGETKK